MTMHVSRWPLRRAHSPVPCITAMHCAHSQQLAQVFTITVPVDQEEQVHALVRSMSANAKRTYALAGTSKYEIPCSDIQLSEIFDRMADARAQGIAVLDWGVHNASLEDVFIRLAQQASAPELDLAAV